MTHNDTTDTDTDTDTHAEINNSTWCGHYRSRCKIIAKCCGSDFGCRICHDEQIDAHKINRYEIEEVICNSCNTRQPISNTCINKKCCNKVFAKYYCDICHLYTDTPMTEIYHCDKCNICRQCSLGYTKTDYFHCDKCGGCILLNLKETHKCITDGLKGDCCICLESIFLSKSSVKIMPCGHVIHSECMNELLNNNRISCPLCRKTILDGESLKELNKRYDSMIETNPYNSNVLTKIKCNDCNFNDKVLFHPVGLKCGGCGGYNTIRDS